MRHNDISVTANTNPIFWQRWPLSFIYASATAPKICCTRAPKLLRPPLAAYMSSVRCEVSCWRQQLECEWDAKP